MMKLVIQFFKYEYSSFFFRSYICSADPPGKSLRPVELEPSVALEPSKERQRPSEEHQGRSASVTCDWDNITTSWK